MRSFKRKFDMNFKLLVIVLALLFLSNLAVAQTKNEKEVRIKGSEFPAIAQDIINKLPNKCKRLKFYKETDGDKQSFEVKFKYKKRRYSIEFSTNGTIEDIEVTTKLKTIEDSVKDTITSHFKTSFIKHKVIKTQKQYVYSSEIDMSKFVTKVLSQNSKTLSNYEIM